MIPKTIHYCWFGGRPLPASARRCIASWRKYLPDHEIKEWNESNFDINAIGFTRQAAEMGKWAFVSDYARFAILYEHGGIYFDTDVEVIRPIDDILARGAYMGWEKERTMIGVASGLGMAAPKGLPVYEEIIAHYGKLRFADDKGRVLPGTVVRHVTEVLMRHGLKLEDTLQEVADVTIYPNEYFNPLDDFTGRLNITPDTRTIHHYAKTWIDGHGPVRTFIARIFHRLQECFHT